MKAIVNVNVWCPGCGVSIMERSFHDPKGIKPDTCRCTNPTCTLYGKVFRQPEIEINLIEQTEEEHG